jgi:hypothetical protein
MSVRSRIDRHRSHRFQPETLESRRLFSTGPTFNGAGVPVAQVEADFFGPNQFEVSPTAVNQPASLFTYISDAATVTGTPPPNTAGIESGHADSVGNIFYGGNGFGIAPGVSHVDNYEVNHFINSVITASSPPNIRAKVINQSFVATDVNGQAIQDPVIDQAYDNYVARYNKIIVSSAGGPKPGSPSTAYNSISVGASDSTIVAGPTVDGRSKPDISAPGGDTSYSAPFVAGAAADLVQAGNQGYGGWFTASDATDAQTIKALLLNGATKPGGWTHTPVTPLDPRYGAGVVNFSGSLSQLEGGEHSYSASTNTTLGGPHLPPNGHGMIEPSASGWGLNSISTGALTDSVNHYEFALTQSGSSSISLTATLTWERHLNQATINNLDLYLYNLDTHTLVDQSISGVDNVEQLFTTNLPAGHYDLEVLKHGGTPGVTPGDVSNGETYALAFDFAGASVARGNLGGFFMFFGDKHDHDGGSSDSNSHDDLLTSGPSQASTNSSSAVSTSSMAGGSPTIVLSPAGVPTVASGNQAHGLGNILGNSAIAENALGA